MPGQEVFFNVSFYFWFRPKRIRTMGTLEILFGRMHGRKMPLRMIVQHKGFRTLRALEVPQCGVNFLAMLVQTVDCCEFQTTVFTDLEIVKFQGGRTVVVLF
jgi:hypothetical protein